MKHILLILTILLLTVAVAQSRRFTGVNDSIRWMSVIKGKTDSGQATLSLISAKDSLFVVVIRRYSSDTGDEATPDSLFYTMQEMYDARKLAQETLAQVNSLLVAMDRMF